MLVYNPKSVAPPMALLRFWEKRFFLEFECLKYLIQHTQKIYYSPEYTQLKEKGVLTDKKSSLARLNITLKEGVICLHSRLAQNELLPEQLRFPKVLPPYLRLTFLIVTVIHTNLSHAGTDESLYGPIKCVYICVFCCFATRYIHCEFMKDRTITSFLQYKRMSNFFRKPESF